MNKGASFSDCGKYRYSLWRIWDDFKPRVMCIGLNPSTANVDTDDPTIRILIKHLTALGFGGFYICNLYSLVSSKPEALHDSPDPIKDNAKYISTTHENVSEVIFCWGDFKGIDFLAKRMIALMPEGKCFGKNKSGSPMHPMALMYSGITPGSYQLRQFSTKQLNQQPL